MDETLSKALHELRKLNLDPFLVIEADGMSEDHIDLRDIAVIRILSCGPTMSRKLHFFNKLGTTFNLEIWRTEEEIEEIITRWKSLRLR